MELTNCPCGHPYRPTDAFGEAASQCNGCGNLFIAPEPLERILSGLLRTYTPPQLDELRAQCRGRAGGLVSTIRSDVRMYYDCPVCEHTMTRRAFAPTSGIVVHQCVRHGTLGAFNWLRQAVEFVERGGELLVLKAELEAAQTKIRELKVRPDFTSRRAPLFTPPPV